MSTAPPASISTPSDRLISIQFLRIISAIWVVALHQAFAFAEFMGTGLGLSQRWPGLWDGGNHIGNVAVCGFFIISGYIMVYTSRAMFGQKGARRLFWTRRAVRVYPPYWLTTLLLVAILIVLRAQEVGGAELLKSLLLVPYWSGAAFSLTLPLMWVGWTLFYEMVFYFLFGLFVAFPRSRAIAFTITALVALVVAGALLEPQSAPLWMATRPVLLVFIAGMLLALWRERGGRLPLVLRVIAFAIGVGLIIVLDAKVTFGPTDWDYLLWAALPAVLLALAIMGGDIRWPRPALIDRWGDVSFALYLLHVPAANFWTFVWQTFGIPGGAWPFLITLVTGTLIASWYFFLWVERPMTRFLNRKLGAKRM